MSLLGYQTLVVYGLVFKKQGGIRCQLLFAVFHIWLRGLSYFFRNICTTNKSFSFFNSFIIICLFKRGSYAIEYFGEVFVVESSYFSCDVFYGVFGKMTEWRSNNRFLALYTNSKIFQLFS
jgi:phosphotransferase system  glucose/maltose/N-acetylglucosamine-specific IIC component